MNSTAQQYESARAALAGVVDRVPADQWSAPSPCVEWTARDVVRHVVETQREFCAGRGIDVGPAPDLDGDPAAAWGTHAAWLGTVLADDTVVTTPYDGFFGPTTVGATFEQFYVWDMVVHRWDVATAAGMTAGLTRSELQQIERGADGFSAALYMDGICRPGVQAPAGAGEEVRVLARLGRRA